MFSKINICSLDAVEEADSLLDEFKPVEVSVQMVFHEVYGRGVFAVTICFTSDQICVSGSCYTVSVSDCMAVKQIIIL